MEISKKTLIIVVLAILSFSFVSCEKEDQLDTVEDKFYQEQSFKYKQEVKVEDESKQYYVVVSIQSDSKKFLEEAIRNKPYITIGSFYPDSYSQLNHINDSSIPVSENKVMYILTKDRNIPRGIGYSFHMTSEDFDELNVVTKGVGCVPVDGDHIESAVFRDDLANEIYVANHGHDCGIKIKIYTRGSKSWSWGWYKRLDKVLSNPYAVLLDRRTYNAKEPGIKVTAEALYNLNGLSWYVMDSE